MPIIQQNPAWANILSGLVGAYGVQQGMKRRKQEDERQKQIDAQNAAVAQANINYETAQTDYEKARTNQMNAPEPGIPKPQGKNGKPPTTDDWINYWITMAGADPNPDRQTRDINMAGVLGSRVQYPQENIDERRQYHNTLHQQFEQGLAEKKREAIARIGEQRYQANLIAARRSMGSRGGSKGRGGMSMQDREDMVALSAYYRSMGMDAMEADRNAQQEYESNMAEWKAGFDVSNSAGQGQQYIQNNPPPSPTINVNSPQQQPQILMIQMPDGRKMPVVMPNQHKQQNTPTADPKATPQGGKGGAQGGGGFGTGAKKTGRKATAPGKPTLYEYDDGSWLPQ